VAAVGVAAVVISLVPLPHTESVRFGPGWRRLDSWSRMPSYPDFFSNILLFVPLGYGVIGTLRRADAGMKAALLTVALVLGFSLALEMSQLFVSGRFATVSDVLAHAIGAIVGIACWRTQSGSTR
jgi:VanZ family protein